MIYLDTHVVVWLYSGLTDKLSELAKSLINDNEIYISPIVRLELQYLYEIKRITHQPDTIIAELFEQIDLQICSKSFNQIISISLGINWTRDPFDRIITANAQIGNNILLSKDENILNNYICAKW
ncbi:type II toxin-antitoxin system VapC family toxin [Calothrix sp. PCC 7507]|uniref:type II toxin-antitoxin system VapC family toxin n=1 Tax=Calothrix sp. PCC 7507 TaxID=99598 RepID=UPI00029F2B16|nr:PIN domain-containing protein [Calothrix sp. PCC 7507]AFY34204.1 PilT protein domain protein [Calothrix sp. PCC 7507]